MKPAQILEAGATGFFLAAMQVALGFTLMCGAGASVFYYFVLVAVWIAGSATGVLYARDRSGAVVLALSLLAAGAGRFIFAVAPCSAWGTVTILVAAFLSGFYAGAFFKDRTARWGAVRQLLLHENNGFVLGYITATLMLILSARTLDVTALAIGVSLLCVRLRR